MDNIVKLLEERLAVLEREASNVKYAFHAGEYVKEMMLIRTQLIDAGRLREEAEMKKEAARASRKG